jgi:hypothetical protein
MALRISSDVGWEEEVDSASGGGSVERGCSLVEALHDVRIPIMTKPSKHNQTLMLLSFITHLQ